MPAKPTLLVVDPRAENRSAATRVWSRSFIVLAVSTGEEAIATMRRTPPALVFAEFDLPDVDGTTLEYRVRDITELSSIPIVFTSGWESREKIVHQLVAFGLIERLDDECFFRLVRGVTTLTSVARARKREPAPEPVDPVDPLDPVETEPNSSSKRFDPDEGRAHLVRRLVYA